jgi:hypothetical protein
MCVRLVPARGVLIAAAGALICASAASAQRSSSSAGGGSGDAPIVMIMGNFTPPAPRGSARWSPLARNLTSQQKAAIVSRAFPKGLPPVPPAKTTVDPTGLSKQVVLGPERLYDPDHTATLMLFGADYRPPMGPTGFAGDIGVKADARFTVSYRPAKAGAPVMIECQLEGGGEAFSKLGIKPYDQSAAVASHATVYKQNTLAFVVLPTSIGWNAVQIKVESGWVQVHACAVTPLS